MLVLELQPESNFRWRFFRFKITPPYLPPYLPPHHHHKQDWRVVLVARRKLAEFMCRRFLVWQAAWMCRSPARLLSSCLVSDRVMNYCRLAALIW